MASRALRPSARAARKQVHHVLGILALMAVSACVPSRSAPVGPRALPQPERIGGGAVLLGAELHAVPEELIGAVEYDLPVVANSWVQAEMEFLLTERRDVVRSWLERSDRYAGFVQSVFRSEGLPTDLYHLAMIESGYVAVARSPVGAVGMWQFMPAASRDAGLRIDSNVDERMDPVRSTRAAARHLKTLFRVHGDWALAAAAYNAGSGRISRSLERFGATDFWDLARRGDLAAETQHYVPRLYAMTIIGRDRERFGFEPGPESATFAFDSVHVDSSVSLDELAHLAGLDAERVSELNPHLLQGITPTGGYWVWVPATTGPTVQRAYLAAEVRRRQTVAYTVRWGDSLGLLASLSGLPASRIRELNPDVDFDRLLAGSTIQLPADAAGQLASRTNEVPPEERPTVAAAVRAPAPEPEPEPSVTTHTVEAGETLSGIARRYGTTVADIQEENRITGSVIRPGQELRIASVEAGSEDGGSGDGAAIVEHVVERGETLWGIARRYGSSVDAIQAANELGSRPIVPGQTLTVPREATR